MEITSDLVFHLLGDGNDSQIERLYDDEELPLQRPPKSTAGKISTPSSPIPSPPTRRPGNVPQRRSDVLVAATIQSKTT